MLDERTFLTDQALVYKNDFNEEELDELSNFLAKVSRRIFAEENLKAIIARRK